MTNSQDIEYLKKEAWSRGKIIPGQDPDIVRQDDFGYWMRYDHYQRGSLGWEIQITDTLGKDIHPISLQHIYGIIVD